MLTGNWTYYLRDEGMLEVPGCSFGYGTRGNPRLVGRNGDLVVLKEPGSSYWSGRGMTGYAAAHWILVRVAWLDGDKAFKVVKVIEEVAPGKKWKATKDALLRRMDQLAVTVEKLP